MQNQNDFLPSVIAIVQSIILKDINLASPEALLLKEDMLCQSIWIWYTTIKNYLDCQYR